MSGVLDLWHPRMIERFSTKKLGRELVEKGGDE
jgi:hypothetical protein